MQVALVALNGIRTDPTGEGKSACIVAQLNENLTGDVHVIGDIHVEVQTVTVVLAADRVKRNTGLSRCIITLPAPDLNRPAVEVESYLLLEGGHSVDLDLLEKPIANVESHTVLGCANNVVNACAGTGKLSQNDGLVVRILNVDVNHIQNDHVTVRHLIVEVQTVVTVGQGGQINVDREYGSRACADIYTQSALVICRPHEGSIVDRLAAVHRVTEDTGIDAAIIGNAVPAVVSEGEVLAGQLQHCIGAVTGGLPAVVGKGLIDVELYPLTVAEDSTRITVVHRGSHGSTTVGAGVVHVVVAGSGTLYLGGVIAVSAVLVCVPADLGTGGSLSGNLSNGMNGSGDHFGVAPAAITGEGLHSVLGTGGSLGDLGGVAVTGSVDVRINEAIATTTGVSGVTLLGTGGRSYGGYVVVTGSRNYNCPAAQLDVTDGAVNNALVRTGGGTTGGGGVLDNSLAGGVTKLLCNNPTTNPTELILGAGRGGAEDMAACRIQNHSTNRTNLRLGAGRGGAGDMPDSRDLLVGGVIAMGAVLVCVPADLGTGGRLRIDIRYYVGGNFTSSQVNALPACDVAEKLNRILGVHLAVAVHVNGGEIHLDVPTGHVAEQKDRILGVYHAVAVDIAGKSLIEKDTSVYNGKLDALVVTVIYVLCIIRNAYACNVIIGYVLRNLKRKGCQHALDRNVGQGTDEGNRLRIREGLGSRDVRAELTVKRDPRQRKAIVILHVKGKRRKAGIITQNDIHLHGLPGNTHGRGNGQRHWTVFGCRLFGKRQKRHDTNKQKQ